MKLEVIAKKRRKWPAKAKKERVLAELSGKIFQKFVEIMLGTYGHLYPNSHFEVVHNSNRK